ncbi:MAG TPA: PaaI family thioesterase [Polyangiaceae bacterium]|jgi:acyl-coenzyme A thioesterase PaaI-like protein|nr:MAG: Thioesterase superfamily protein [Deltaproteobacteria bacterium ADurb.Bin207]HOH01786.1 PaaI family thioesterase [Polyangiaceae bacterium]HOR35692.1 PaaI family thioesterase [Polyangiaceae bacterium]HQF25929.1 PaaI family thioesterase [Polyangiaceae bacterium]HQM12588.1 PaaI family thioesterase [Polyangiaceae bacterium]
METLPPSFLNTLLMNPSHTTAEASPCLAPEPQWEEIAELAASPPNSFVSGEEESHRLRVRYYRRSSDGALVGKAWFGPGSLGPPGHAHGGSMAAVLDETMGLAAWLAGHRVVAARLEVDFIAMLPLGTVAIMETSLHHVENRKIFLTATLKGPDKTLFARAQGLFIRLSQEKEAHLRDIWEASASRPSSRS